MLWNVISTRFFTKPVCWQNSVVIFEKSYLPYMTFFWLKFRELIALWLRNPKKLSLHQLDFYSSRYSSQNGRRSTLADCEIWLWRLRFPCSSLFYFLSLAFQKYMDVIFLIPLESLHLTLRAHALHKTSTKGQICQLPQIYYFLHLSSKSAFKT
jgi:hypothetical protein